jgi:hypothetical protein
MQTADFTVFYFQIFKWKVMILVSSRNEIEMFTSWMKTVFPRTTEPLY